jgi:hypothetical protein
MTVRCFAVLFVLLLGAVPSHASDPWDPNRKFCGRLLIIIVGAGEWAIEPNGKASDPEAMDSVSTYAYAHFLALRRSDSKALSGYSIVMTSDSRLTEKLNKLPQKLKDEAGFLGTTPASMDTFENLSSIDGKLSLLQRAIDNFANDKACLAATTPDEHISQGQHLAILPFLKVEIVIVTPNTGNGARGYIPLWPHASDSGTKKELVKMEIGNTLLPSMIVRLQNRLRGALVQTFVTSCAGVDIGETFQVPDECSCYLSVTDDKAYFYPSGINGAWMKLKPTATEAFNITSLATSSLSQFQTYRPEWDTIFAVGDHENPLQSLLYNSADARAERVLNAFAKQKLDGERPKKILDASFAESLPPKVTVTGTTMTDPQLRRVLEATENVRKHRYWNDLHTPTLEFDGEFAASMNAFRRCHKWKSPQPEVCGTILKLLTVADTGTGGGGKQTREERDLIIAYNALLDEFDSSHAETLVERYQRGAITISELFARLNSLWKKFMTNHKKLTVYAKDHYHNQLPSDFKAALRISSSDFQDAFYSVQKQFFPLLRENTLEVRLVRIEEAAKLLAIYSDDIVGLDPKEELRQLGNDLVCLTAFPVGPAFDAQYGKK